MKLDGTSQQEHVEGEQLDGTSQQEHVKGEKLDGTSQQDHIDGEGYHMENHTTVYTEHEVEIDGVQLKERKETTTNNNSITNETKHDETPEDSRKEGRILPPDQEDFWPEITESLVKVSKKKHRHPTQKKQGIGKNMFEMIIIF